MKVSTADVICKEWRISETEYLLLDKQFGKLCEKQAWILLQKNYRNNHTDEQVDIAQDMRLAMIRAGSYYKRQLFIEKCLELCEKYAPDRFHSLMVESLKNLWLNKTRHGANRQKFGPPQEKMLFRLTRKIVPKKIRPNKKEQLTSIGPTFERYCKSITWNEMKAKGKKITREKAIRSNQVSISEFDFLA